MSVRKIRKLGAGLVVTGTLVVNLIIGMGLYDTIADTTDADEAYEKIAVLTRAIQHIRQSYVDSDKTSYDALIDSALDGMLRSLDEHSQYMSPDVYTSMRESTQGQFGGIGIEINLRDGFLTVITPIDDTPAFHAGVRAGDRIIAVDGVSTVGISLTESVEKLRGEVGHEVVITVIHPNEDQPTDIPIVRDVIKVSSIRDTRELDDNIGYIRISQFSEPTADALKDELQKLTEKPINGFILDLRDNPGGLLESAARVSELFLKKNSPIVATKGRGGALVRSPYRSRGQRHYVKFPMVILVNGQSASASEIVAGALQDNKRAIIVGEQTYGKGSVQSIIPMDDGSALRLTTAKYYTPSERVIHQHGITPDIVVPLSDEVWAQIRRQRVAERIGEPASDDAKPAVDLQLQRAVEIIKGINIFQVQGKAPADAG